MTGCMGPQGADPQCTFPSISSRKSEVRPHHILENICLVFKQIDKIFIVSISPELRMIIISKWSRNMRLATVPGQKLLKCRFCVTTGSFKLRSCISAFQSHPESYPLARKDLRKVFSSPVLCWPIKNHVTEDCGLF